MSNTVSTSVNIGSGIQSISKYPFAKERKLVLAEYNEKAGIVVGVLEDGDYFTSKPPEPALKDLLYTLDNGREEFIDVQLISSATKEKFALSIGPDKRCFINKEFFNSHWDLYVNDRFFITLCESVKSMALKATEKLFNRDHESCECGSHAPKSQNHSTWCQMFMKELK